jgi:hypothetical protein
VERRHLGVMQRHDRRAEAAGSFLELGLVPHLAIARRSTNGELVSAATRSMPAITPITPDPGENTGTWRMS